MMCIEELVKDVDLSTEDGIAEVCAKINRLNVSETIKITNTISFYDYKFYRKMLTIVSMPYYPVNVT